MRTPAAARSSPAKSRRHSLSPPTFVGRARAIGAILHLAATTLVALPIQILAVKHGWRLGRTLPVWWHKTALKAAGVKVTTLGSPAGHRPLLVTSNHISWLDISVIGSQMPLSFVAKSEVATWPLFGLFARLQRTVFVERARRHDAGRAAREIADRLADGDAMVLFPEGTSSNGTHVLPFRSALIGAARNALAGGHEQVLVQPLAVVFARLGGLPTGRADRPLVAWYGDMELPRHLWDLFAAGPIDIYLLWGNPIPFDEKTDRKALARTLEDQIRDLVATGLANRPGLHFQIHGENVAERS